MDRQDVDDYFDIEGIDALVLDGFDDSIARIYKRFGQPDIVVCEWESCIENLIARGMSLEDAREYFDFNIAGSWMGDWTPAFIISGKNIRSTIDEDKTICIWCCDQKKFSCGGEYETQYPCAFCCPNEYANDEERFMMGIKQITRIAIGISLSESADRMLGLDT